MSNQPLNNQSEQTESQDPQNPLNHEQAKSLAWQPFDSRSLERNKPSERYTEFAAYTLDITSGLEVCLQMLHHDSVAGEVDNSQLLFNKYTAGCLMRMCIASIAELSNKASEVLYE